MCTALSFTTHDHYFGRTLDLDCSYGEQVCVTPRNFPFHYRKSSAMPHHYAMIGMAMVIADTPLYYDAVNEKGLGMAGLNFPGNAFYHAEKEGCDNIAPFEFIPCILGQCATVSEARKLLERINLADIPFSSQMPLSPLHWIISDKKESLVVESMADGIHIHENPVGVLTNNPPFAYHICNLNNYRGLSIDTPVNTFSPKVDLNVYCQGLGAMGLPGDISSMSRFVRTVFHAHNSVCDTDEESSVSQFFHVLQSVEMIRGCCLTDQGHWDITVYTSCANADKGLYYYTTYDNHQISCVDMYQTDLDSDMLSIYPLVLKQQIHYH